MIQDPRQGAEALLAEWSMSLEHLAEIARPASKDQAVLLVGSLATGHANGLSDIDILVLGGERPSLPEDAADFGSSGVVFRTSSGREVDVTHYDDAFLAALAAKMEACHELILRPRSSNIPNLERVEYALIHQIRVGISLTNHEAAAHYKTLLRTDELKRHAIIKHLVSHYVLREDAIGQMQVGDNISAFWILRTAMASLAEADLAAEGETHYRREWLLRHLAAYRAALGAETSDAYLRSQCEWPDDLSLAAFRQALTFADGRVASILGRAHELIPVVMALGQKASTIQSI